MNSQSSYITDIAGYSHILKSIERLVCFLFRAHSKSQYSASISSQLLLTQLVVWMIFK